MFEQKKAESSSVWAFLPESSDVSASDAQAYLSICSFLSASSPYTLSTTAPDASPHHHHISAVPATNTRRASPLTTDCEPVHLVQSGEKQQGNAIRPESVDPAFVHACASTVATKQHHLFHKLKSDFKGAADAIQLNADCEAAEKTA